MKTEYKRRNSDFCLVNNQLSVGLTEDFAEVPKSAHKKRQGRGAEGEEKRDNLSPVVCFISFIFYSCYTKRFV
jgi:hypothetical protein